MAMTVKNLISELEKIENKYLEVEIFSPYFENSYLELDHVSKINKKIIICPVYGNDRCQ